MKFTIHYAVAARGTWAVDAESADAALAAFRAAGDQRHAFAAYERRAPTPATVEAVVDEERGVTLFPDGKVQIK